MNDERNGLGSGKRRAQGRDFTGDDFAACGTVGDLGNVRSPRVFHVDKRNGPELVAAYPRRARADHEGCRSKRPSHGCPAIDFFAQAQEFPVLRLAEQDDVELKELTPERGAGITHRADEPGVELHGTAETGPDRELVHGPTLRQKRSVRVGARLEAFGRQPDGVQLEYRPGRRRDARRYGDGLARSSTKGPSDDEVGLVRVVDFSWSTVTSSTMTTVGSIGASEAARWATRSAAAAAAPPADVPPDAVSDGGGPRVSGSGAGN